MTENKTKVTEELSKAGETSLITPLLLKLDKLRIVSTSDIEDEDFLFNINGKPCLPRKDLTVITGQPKTGKTMLISILMACCARDAEGDVGGYRTESAEHAVHPQKARDATHRR